MVKLDSQWQEEPISNTQIAPLLRLLGKATKQSYPQGSRAGWVSLITDKHTRTKLVISCTNGDRKMKFNSKGEFEMKYSFLKPCSRNVEVITPLVGVINPQMGQKVPIGISITNVYRKSKIKGKRYIKVHYSFMKASSQNFEILTQHGDVINPKLAQKREQTQISFTNGHRKSKVKWTLRYSFMKLFPRNLEILQAPGCELISEMHFPTSWNCGRFWSLIQLAALGKSLF